MTARSLARIALLALMLGILSAGLALAQPAPMSAVQPPVKTDAPAMSAAPAQPGLPLDLTTPKPSPKVCWYYGMYDEFVKNGEICRWRNSCEGSAYHGTCPNGYDYHTTETIICYC